MQTPHQIKLPACTRKHLNITLPIPARATIGVGKPQADSECNERTSPDGFDMAALENHCPQASSRGDVGDSPTYFKEGSSVLTVTQKMNKPHREIKVDFGLYTKSRGFSVTGITLCHEIFRFFFSASARNAPSCRFCKFLSKVRGRLANPDAI